MQDILCFITLSNIYLYPSAKTQAQHKQIIDELQAHHDMEVQYFVILFVCFLMPISVLHV